MELGKPGRCICILNGGSGHITIQPEGKQSHVPVFLGYFELLASIVTLWSSHASDDVNPRCSCSYTLSGLPYASSVLCRYNDNSLGFSTGGTGVNSLRWPQLSGMLYSTWSRLCLVGTRCVCAMDWSLTLPSLDTGCRRLLEKVASGIWLLILLQAMAIRAWPFAILPNVRFDNLQFCKVINYNIL